MESLYNQKFKILSAHAIEKKKRLRWPWLNEKIKDDEMPDAHYKETFPFVIQVPNI